MDVVVTSDARLARGAIERIKPNLVGALDDLVEAVTQAVAGGELERGGDVRLPLADSVQFRPGFPGARIVALEAQVRHTDGKYEIFWVTLVLVGGAGGHYPHKKSRE